MEETKIALLGLGLMGSGMAGRLLDAGYPLSIWNRTPGKTQALADRGAKVANSPRAAAKDAQVVISMLADVPVCRDVWTGRAAGWDDPVRRMDAPTRAATASATARIVISRDVILPGSRGTQRGRPS